MVRAYEKRGEGDFRPVEVTGRKVREEEFIANAGTLLSGQAAELTALLIKITTQRRKNLNSGVYAAQADEVLERMIALAEKTRRELLG